jgi:outer membrane protein insertion porin family
MKSGQFKPGFRHSAVAAVLTLAVNAAWAVTPFQVSDIRVEGLQRVEPGTIFASLPFKVGETYNDDKGTAAIRSLFALGLFKDVRIDIQGNVTVVIVEERPHIANIEFTGVTEFDKDNLRKALKEIGLTEGRPYDKAIADRAEQELKRQYIGKSFYAADVTTTATPQERNRVNLTFSVVEGESAKIKEITIVGNKAFSNSTLLNLFDLDAGSWMSWYTKSNRYSRAKFNADMQTMISYYMDRGYAEFKIDSTQIAISPDKQSINVTVSVNEGPLYVVSEVRMEGEFLGKQEEFTGLVKVEPGKPYNAQRVSETVQAFTEQFAAYGYAFARIQIRPEFDRVNNRVAVVLTANPERRAFVRKVIVTGNARTRDEVVRREFRQFEASWYDGQRIKLSRDRVDRLGFFKDVQIETTDVPGTNDQVDLIVNVSEKPTGNLSLGAGFSSTEKLSLTFGIRQENIFGSGNYLGLDVTASKYNRIFVISTTDPYFTKDGISRTIDVFNRSSKPLPSQGGRYTLGSHGASIRFGVPFSERDTVFFGMSAERTSINSGTSIPAAYLAYAQIHGYSSTTLPLTLGWARDGRDSALVPTKGQYQRLNTEYAAFGDVNYVKTSYQFQQYVPLNKQYSLAFNADFGWGKGLSGQPYPVFKNYFGGGLGSVRGYDQGTLGPRDITGAYIGGAKKAVLNNEIVAPFPGAGNDRTFRIFGFFDVGNVYGEHEKMSFKDMRMSTGVGLRWISPMGPLSFSWAQAKRLQPGDRISKLQFQIGTAF